MTSLSGSSAMERDAIPTTTNTAYETSKIKDSRVEEYEMVDGPPESLPPPAIPVTSLGTDVYESIPAPEEQ